ncbi:hypothetical protein METBIDRAFT_201511 [Metschnikowia bicuspidata var. bicuspidata NRRL YB-4993]|uniref:Uncharacterized protein n=1 Tax=Metschnikowia bicuspidata var. bicuspidata NRRL YB-4993 TaxID=869754 RepID=A0A1A0H9P6_9ASCO|nr:hypothetical protein METBIDRAFT_201511 [Metschnikowia bicuspidata var. bicuspidata NRRL YB-4993]OBA20607.1 hypothetical protein METBIDRAFT_201511 [Metschnikowia bicuspidata var. bicuspidata NRRL YB-4993]
MKQDGPSFDKRYVLRSCSKVFYILLYSFVRLIRRIHQKRKSKNKRERPVVYGLSYTS